MEPSARSVASPSASLCPREPYSSEALTQNTNVKIQEPTNRTFMNHSNVDSNRMDLHRRIALVLRKEPGLVRDFAERLRSKLTIARSAAVVSDNEWEWYIILTLWSPLQVIRLRKIPANKPSGFARILPLSLCYLSLWLFASSNICDASSMLGEFFFRENLALKPPAARIHSLPGRQPAHWRTNLFSATTSSRRRP